MVGKRSMGKGGGVDVVVSGWRLEYRCPGSEV